LESTSETKAQDPPAMSRGKAVAYAISLPLGLLLLSGNSLNRASYAATGVPLEAAAFREIPFSVARACPRY
jgi:hypothetical protein